MLRRSLACECVDLEPTDLPGAVAGHDGDQLAVLIGATAAAHDTPVTGCLRSRRIPLPRSSASPPGRHRRARCGGRQENVPATGAERHALSGPAPPASTARRRRAVDPGDLCQPGGPDGEGQARGQAGRRAANLHRLPTAGSGSGRCGTSDSQVPGGPREACRARRQEHHRPPDSLRCEGTPHERNGAKADQDDTSANAHACPEAQVAVFPWRDYALHARSRGRCPPPTQTFRSSVVIRFVHRDASRQLWCRPPDRLSI
jgi:hypothetical protein